MEQPICGTFSRCGSCSITVLSENGTGWLHHRHWKKARGRRLLMLRSFDSVAFVKSVGEALVAAFEAGGLATTPGLTGSSREAPVRQQLGQLLPHGMGVGSGCVIDSFGNASRQMDVILYENEICPAFVLNQDPASTYYPCEGVIAVGEVKSTLASAELEDVFAKIESVKRLRRFTRESSARGWKYVAFRKFGSIMSAATSADDGYDQESKSSDQIFGFALAGRVVLSCGDPFEQIR